MKALKLTGITLPGAGYLALADFLPLAAPAFPASSGLVGLYTFGKTEALSLINRVNGALPLVKVGAPAISAVGGAMSQANCFDTQLASMTEQTVIVVAKPVLTAIANQGAMLVSNYLNGATNAIGDSLALRDTNSEVGYAQNSISFQSCTLSIAGADTTAWNTFSHRIKPTGESKVWKSVSGAVTAGVESGAGTRAPTQARTLLVGGHYEGTQFQSGVSILMAAIWNRALTDAEMTSNLAYLNTTYGPSLGIGTL